MNSTVLWLMTLEKKTFILHNAWEPWFNELFIRHKYLTLHIVLFYTKKEKIYLNCFQEIKFYTSVIVFKSFNVMTVYIGLTRIWVCQYKLILTITLMDADQYRRFAVISCVACFVKSGHYLPQDLSVCAESMGHP